MERKTNIPKLYYIISFLFVFFDLFYFAVEQTAALLILGLLSFLFVFVGIVLLALFRKDDEKKKYLIRGIIIYLLLALVSSLVLVPMTNAQQTLFTQDSRNLAQVEPFSFKAYSQIKTSELWDLLNKNDFILSSVKIGIIDTGVDVSNGRHPEFQNVSINALSPRLFKDSNPEGHGTQITGIIGADNLSFPDSSNYIFPQMNGILSGVHNLNYSLELGRKPLLQLPLFGLASAVDGLVKKDVKVINMSFGTGTIVPAVPAVIEIFLPVFSKVFAKNSNVLFVVGAGQYEHDFFGFTIEGVNAELVTPANLGDNFNNVITVGATDITPGAEDQRLSFSNFGGAVSIAAPGIAVFAPAPRGAGNFPISAPIASKNYDAFFSGTSASAPMVTGVAAILKALESEYQKHTPGLVMTPAKIKEILQKSADPIKTDKQLGSGCFDPNNNPQKFDGCRLNAFRAISWLLPPTPVILNTPVVIPAP